MRFQTGDPNDGDDGPLDPDEKLNRDLARRAAGGCSAARDQLYQRMEPWLRGVVATVSRGTPDFVDDALQSVALHLLQQLPKYNPARALRPWLAMVVRNKVFDLMAAERKHVGVPLDDEPGRDDPAMLEEVEQRLALWECIYFDCPLCREERVIVVFDDQSLGGVNRTNLANHLGISLQALSRFWASARERLLECMTRKGF
jgi:RNA polymerase sigma factor (sigma-70 family)